MSYFMQCIDKNKSYRLLGSMYEFIFDDLKTLQGVLNRIKRYNINHGMDFEVYQFYGHLLDNNMKLVYRSYQNIGGLQYEKS